MQTIFLIKQPAFNKNSMNQNTPFTVFISW